MSLINNNAKEIHLKVVYYGPSLGGKTTNIQWIYKTTHPDQKSKLIDFGEENERTTFFDFLPLSYGEIRGYKTRFHLFSVPGQIAFDNRRKLVLRGLDGVVFVADSQRERIEENLQAMKNLETNLKQQGYDIRQIPLVLQYNKRDLPSASRLSDLRLALNKYNSPEFEASASEGVGVFETLSTVSKMIVTMLKSGNI
jgi:signal recognition particle receptor subunit beta